MVKIADTQLVVRIGVLCRVLRNRFTVIGRTTEGLRLGGKALRVER